MRAARNHRVVRMTSRLIRTRVPRRARRSSAIQLVRGPPVAIAVASCRWTAGELPYAQKVKLDVLGTHLSPDGPPPQQFFFSRDVFAPEPVQAAERGGGIRLVTPEALFR